MSIILNRELCMELGIPDLGTIAEKYSACSWCKKAYERATGDRVDFPPYEIFESHGICGPCKSDLFRKVEAYKNAKNL